MSGNLAHAQTVDTRPFSPVLTPYGPENEARFWPDHFFMEQTSH